MRPNIFKVHFSFAAFRKTQEATRRQEKKISLPIQNRLRFEAPLFPAPAIVEREETRAAWLRALFYADAKARIHRRRGALAVAYGGTFRSFIVFEVTSQLLVQYCTRNGLFFPPHFFSLLFAILVRSSVTNVFFMPGTPRWPPLVLKGQNIDETDDECTAVQRSLSARSETLAAPVAFEKKKSHRRKTQVMGPFRSSGTFGFFVWHDSFPKRAHTRAQCTFTGFQNTRTPSGVTVSLSGAPSDPASNGSRSHISHIRRSLACAVHVDQAFRGSSVATFEIVISLLLR